MLTMLRERLYAIAVRLYPGLSRIPESERYAAAGYVWRALLFVPPSLIGIIWLIRVTDSAIFREHWLFLLILFGFLLLFSTLWLELYFVTVSGSYRSERRSFCGESMWSVVLVFGRSVAWLGLLLPWVVFWIQRREGCAIQRLLLVSQSVFRTSVLLPTLVEVVVYERLGGRFPLPSLNWYDVLPAVVATLVGFTLGSLMIAISQGISRTLSPISVAQRTESFQLALFMALLGPVAGLVAIFPAGFYSGVGASPHFVLPARIPICSSLLYPLTPTTQS